MRASGRHPGGRVAGGEGLLAGLIHDVPLVLARHFVGNLRSLLLAVAVLLALALRRALRHARCLSPTKGENRGRPEVTGIQPPSPCTFPYEFEVGPGVARFQFETPCIGSGCSLMRNPHHDTTAGMIEWSPSSFPS